MAAKGNKLLAGARFLAQDKHGRSLISFTKNIGLNTSVLAWPWVVNVGLDLMWSSSFHHIILEVDSKLVAQLISLKWDLAGWNRETLRDICDLFCHD